MHVKKHLGFTALRKQLSKRLQQNNLRTIFEVEAIPSDTKTTGGIG